MSGGIFSDNVTEVRVSHIMDRLRTIENQFDEAQDCASTMTHLPHRDALRIAKVLKNIEKVKKKFYSAFAIASTRTRRPKGTPRPQHDC